MSFAENLRRLRKEQGLSQEELADIMDVSRQAVSKWEQGESYPEVEKLLLLSSKFHISLDSLMSSESVGTPGAASHQPTGTITTFSPHENRVVACCKVLSSQRMKGGNHAPQYAIFGVNSGKSSFWGEPTTFLAWYADHESVSNEIRDIQQALMQGIPSYELKYSVKVEKQGLRISMVEAPQDR